MTTQKSRPGEKAALPVVMAATDSYRTRPIAIGVSVCRNVMLKHISWARPAVPGEHLTINLGHAERLTCEDERRIRYLVFAASGVQLIGNASACEQLLAYLERHPDVLPGGVR